MIDGSLVSELKSFFYFLRSQEKEKENEEIEKSFKLLMASDSKLMLRLFRRIIQKENGNYS